MVVDSAAQEVEFPRLSPAEVHILLRERPYYVLDVRPLDFDRDASFIPEARLCPLVYLESRYAQIPKDSEIIITDWAMRQSPSAAIFLLEKGYTVRGVLRGGMERWRSEHLPFEERIPDGTICPLGGVDASEGKKD
ncbi:MAG: rhodanese-like domain-containing protein [Desulfovibrionales bacterium]|nr:MAG: rhodanese-like domain-containing protein [Desulfovibrionales bacterium]